MQDKDVIDNIGRALSIDWDKAHPDDKKLFSKSETKNPWSLDRVAKIKELYEENPEKAKKDYPELFYYFDGMLNVKKSQSVHPAGMVISPITLADNVGVFDKDGDLCMFLDMDNVHDYTGLAKYDFLVLKTVQVLNDVFKYLGRPYPRMHEINWDDEDVWEDMARSGVGIFQFEGKQICSR